MTFALSFTNAPSVCSGVNTAMSALTMRKTLAHLRRRNHAWHRTVRAHGDGFRTADQRIGMGREREGGTEQGATNDGGMPVRYQ